jgi:methylated-DNA-[protein]-cysteine S-methyltransferase
MTDRHPDTQTAADLFGPVTPPTPSELRVLHEGLAARAEGDGLLDVAYRTLDSPVGTLLLAATPAGLVRVAYEGEGIDIVLEVLARKVSPRILHAPKRLDDTARQLGEYFSGDRHRFALPLDLSLSGGFRRTVLTYLPGIEYGTTASYREVAEGVDNPKAVRAVGTACATNPLPVIIPCHRVIRTDGLIGSYLGGPEVKRQLLHLESAA